MPAGTLAPHLPSASAFTLDEAPLNATVTSAPGEAVPQIATSRSRWRTMWSLKASASLAELGKDSLRDIWLTNPTILGLRQALADPDNFPGNEDIDRGFTDYSLFGRWTADGVYFVTRLKRKSDYWVTERRHSIPERGIAPRILIPATCAVNAVVVNQLEQG